MSSFYFKIYISIIIHENNNVRILSHVYEAYESAFEKIIKNLIKSTNE